MNGDMSEKDSRAMGNGAAMMKEEAVWESEVVCEESEPAYEKGEPVFEERKRTFEVNGKTFDTDQIAEEVKRNVQEAGNKVYNHLRDKRLFKNSKNRIVCGVCAGIADFFRIDPTIVRLIWAMTCAMGGSGVIAYLIAAIVMPSDKDM